MIGERLRVARARVRKTLKDVAAEVGVTAQEIYKFEDNTAMPSSSVFLRLCTSLDVSAEWMADQAPLDFSSTDTAPQGRHAKYWVREAVNELIEAGILPRAED